MTIDTPGWNVPPAQASVAKDAMSARAVGTVLAWQAWLRRATEQQNRLLWGAIGVPLAVDVARRRERDLAALEDPPHDGARPDDVPVHWHDAGQGPVLLLLNGWTASGLMWPGRWVSRLEQRFRVIRIDNRGTGWSRTAPSPFTIADMADDAAAVLRATDAGAASVLGLSMGGMIAQELALRHPEHVDRLFLVGTRPPAPAHIPSAQDVLDRVTSPVAGQALRRYFTDVWGDICGPGFAAASADSIEELVDQILRRPTPRVFVERQLHAVAGWGGARRLRALEVPTVVVHGGQDRLVPVGNGMRLAQLIRGARYVEVPGAGHLMPLEAPDLLADLIESTGPN